jgi:hypothetical protein
MAEMSSGAALRGLRAVHGGLKKARQVLRQAREDPRPSPKVFAACWDSLKEAHRLMAAIPASAADEAVLTQQLSVQRYATALLVRLRRLTKRGKIEADDDDLSDQDEEEF